MSAINTNTKHRVIVDMCAREAPQQRAAEANCSGFQCPCHECTAAAQWYPYPPSYPTQESTHYATHTPYAYPTSPAYPTPQTARAASPASTSSVATDSLSDAMNVTASDVEQYFPSEGYTHYPASSATFPTCMPPPAFHDTPGLFLPTMSAPPVLPSYIEASQTSKATTPAVTPVKPSIMCCYHKQGKCKMGTACWYSHEGDATTACHYGAGCKAGHRNLIKNGAIDAMPLACPKPAKRTRQPPPPKFSAVPSSMPCPYCGGTNCMETQQFPIQVGPHSTMGLRASCTRCGRFYSV